jgi:hypothetical protein
VVLPNRGKDPGVLVGGAVAGGDPMLVLGDLSAKVLMTNCSLLVVLMFDRALTFGFGAVVHCKYG